MFNFVKYIKQLTHNIFQHNMTNVDTVRQNASIVDKKTNMSYLRAIFPHKYGYARHLAERLNSQGKKSVMGYAYTPNIVAQIVINAYNDQNVEPELVEMAEQYTGLPIEEAAPLYIRKNRQPVAEAV